MGLGGVFSVVGALPSCSGRTRHRLVDYRALPVQNMEVRLSALKLWWCRLFHSPGDKAFAMPKPHPRGQEFVVRCQKCHQVHHVVTPLGWTSPWRAKASIVHQDREDPVQQYQGQWWFWNTKTSMREGPYPSEREARDAYQMQYAEDARKPKTARPNASG